MIVMRVIMRRALSLRHRNGFHAKHDLKNRKQTVRYVKETGSAGNKAREAPTSCADFLNPTYADARGLHYL